jgi:hypothetical protein
MMLVSDTQPAFSNHELTIAVFMALVGNIILAVLLAKIVQMLNRRMFSTPFLASLILQITLLGYFRKPKAPIT